jgi:DNA topoisomerase-2
MLEKKLKLYTTITTSNMHMFTSEQCLRKFDTIQEIIDEYYPVRYKLYETRKEYQLQQLERLIKVLKNKVRFIKEQCDDVIDLRRKKRQVVIDLLKSRSYDIIDGDEDYKYLRGMRIEDVEEENMNKLEDKLAQIQTDYSKLKSTTIEQMWSSEIATFENQYQVYISERNKRINGITAKKKKKKITIKKNIKK